MMHQNRIRWPRGGMSKVFIMVGLMTTTQSTIAASPGVFNIRDYGAVGDGKTLA